MKPMMKWFVCLVSLPLLAFNAHAQAVGNAAALMTGCGRALLAAPAGSDAAARHCQTQAAAAAATRRVLYWNQVALQANAIDHTPTPNDGLRLNADQFGPTRTSRAFAIIHIALFDAVNAIDMRYPSYTGLPRAPSDTSAEAAIAQAARDTLVALYPSQATRFNTLLAQDLARLPAARAKWNGIDVGRRAAAAILALRANDNADLPDPVVGVNYFPDNRPGTWRPDPVSASRIPIALGARWRRVHPFVIPTNDTFNAPPPPALTSAAYTAAFNEIKRLGGDGITTPTQRTPEQTIIGIYWAYDGTPKLGAPPRLYNQIAVEIARPRTTDPVEMARLLALVNVGIADSCMTVWDDKYHYNFWRPVTAVREASPGTGPTGLGDGNPDTRGDPNWTPLGAPASNTNNMPNFTPPFPSYTSSHAGLGTPMFQILRRFYGTDRIAFSFVSDELNGITRDNRGRVRPRVVRSFSTLSQAEAENGVSRIYLGIHWRFDATQGIATGRRVGDYVFNRGLVRSGVVAGAPPVH